MSVHKRKIFFGVGILVFLLSVIGCPSQMINTGSELSDYRPSTPSATVVPKITTNGSVRTGAFLSDGSLILGGTFTTINPEPSPFILRLATDGSRDLTLGLESGFNGLIRAVAQLSDGSLIVG